MFKSQHTGYAGVCSGYCGIQTLSKEDELIMLDEQEKFLEERLELIRRSKKEVAKQKSDTSDTEE